MRLSEYPTEDGECVSLAQGLIKRISADNWNFRNLFKRGKENKIHYLEQCECILRMLLQIQKIISFIFNLDTLGRVLYTLQWMG